MNASERAPQWDLDSIYPGFDADAFTRDREQLKERIASLRSAVADTAARDRDARAWLERCIELLNRTTDLHENLESFAYSSYSVDTTNEAFLAELNTIDELGIPLKGARARFRANLAQLAPQLETLIADSDVLAPYRHFLQEELFYGTRQMEPELEELAGELLLSGADAWSRLQETLASTHTEPWDESTGAEAERKTIVELRALAFHDDRRVREKAFNLELRAWSKLEIPLAYSLNGVKGAAISLQKRRGYTESVEEAIHQSRITRRSLDVLIEAMTESLPMFHRYLEAKAQILGLSKLAFFDLFAPVGSGTAEWDFVSARSLITRQFAEFSEELASFAERAFSDAWIDAAPRTGKVGGAYCISFPIAGESRILANFDGSFGSVSTIAHELGHAYHHEVLKNHSAIHRNYPVTLAETASIFCETLVYNGAVEHTERGGHLSVLETLLQDATQVIVDILTRYKFESALFEQRRESELSPQRLYEMMRHAQRECYGTVLDPGSLHPYMWAVKGHYYRAELGFYNFPYAFGQLFALGLYAQYLAEPTGFPERYKSVLEQTGRASAVEVTRQAGFDIESISFWRAGLEIIRTRVDEFVDLAAAAQQSETNQSS